MIEEEIIRVNLEENIEILFQPILSIKENKVLKYEVFCKLVNEKFNSMSTLETIKKLEDMDYIHILDHIILEKVKKYLTMGVFQLCVNISPKTIVRKDFLEKIETLGNGINNLEIEITERGAFSYTELISKIIKLRKIGVEIVMDDFPIGSSNLENLLKTFIKVVKLDKELAKYLQSEKGKKIYKKIVDLLKEIGSTVIAEGIEREEEFNFIKKIEVDLAQGYFIGKPILEKEFFQKIRV